MKTTPLAPQVPTQPSMSTTGAPAPKKHRIWLWIVLVVVILMMLGGVGIGFIVWGLMKTGGDLNINLGSDDFNYNTNYSTSNTNSVDVDTNWYGQSDLVGDANQGYSFLIPDDWTLDSDDPTDNGSIKNYKFIYEDEVYGETTNHFEFEEQTVPGNQNVTLAEYSSDFVDSLNTGLTNGDYKLLQTDNRVVGLNDYPAYVVLIGDDATGERNYYVLTVIDGVEYEFGVFYFEDQEDQALADFEKVVLTFEVK